MPEEDRRELFRATATAMALRPGIVEKDFWVCFMLDHLFHDSIFRDVYCMGNSRVKESAFLRKELLEQDVVFKQKFYYAKSAHYETATVKSIVLVPRKEQLRELRSDYEAMRNMIYGDVPSFEEILLYLEQLQEEIHNLE